MRLATDLWLSTPRDKVFRVFEDAAALEEMSPPWAHCQLLTPPPARMGPDARIEYRFRLHGIPVRWEALVTVWLPPHCFVDEQRRGPYRRWRHTHTFEDIQGGTLVRDDVEFEVPGGAALGWLVAYDLRRVFAFRHRALQRRFDQPRPWIEPPIVIG